MFNLLQIDTRQRCRAGQFFKLIKIKLSLIELLKVRTLTYLDLKISELENIRT